MSKFIPWRRHSTLRVAVGLLCGFSASGHCNAPAAAQETELPGILIFHANRTPTEAAKVGSSVEVITAEDIAAQSRPTVMDYLAQQPGVSFNQNGPTGALSGIFVRGAASQYVKVYVDGIDVSDPSGTQNLVQFEHLLAGDVNRIELLKGSQSMLYGSEAVGGVINIDTRTADRPGFSNYGLAEYGRYNTRRGSYGAAYRSAFGGIALNVQTIDTDGFTAADERNGNVEDDGYENLTLSGRGDVKLGEAVTIFFAGRSVKADSDIDGFSATGKVTDDANGNFNAKFDQRAGRVGANIEALDGHLVTTVAIQGMRLERDVADSRPTVFNGDRVKAEYQSVLSFNDRVAVLAGADWEKSGYESSRDPGRRTVDTTGVFAQLMIEPLDGLTLTGGTRRDEHETFGRFTTYRATSAYELAATSTIFRASVGSGFRAPSLFELFAPAGTFGPIGNANLQPETSKSWDAGVEQRLLGDRVKLSATYFKLDTDNLIEFKFGTGYVQSDSVVERRGVELAAVAQVMPGLVVSAGYTLTNAETPTTGVRQIRVPRHVTTLGLDATPMDNLNVAVRARIVRDTLDTDFSTFPSTNVNLENHVLLSAKVGYEFAPGWEAYVRGENLLNQQYQTVLDYGTPGLSVYGGVRMDLPSQ